MTWEVFYTPHTDDETIGMAGAIARARALEHDVLVVLVTDNLPSPRGRALFPYRTERLRLQEWRRAMCVLNVTATEHWNIPEAEMTLTPFQVQGEIERRITDVHERLAPLHHHTVWGLHDVSFNGQGSLAHGLCANALVRFALSHPGTSVTLNAVYLYAAERAERRAPMIRYLSEEEHKQKRAALDCYRPIGKSLGYGYRSVPELIDAAAEDPREYCVEVTNGV